MDSLLFKSIESIQQGKAFNNSIKGNFDFQFDFKDKDSLLKAQELIELRIRSI
jgi:hypothetical protein